MTKQDKQKEFIHLLTERVTPEDTLKYPTLGDIKERLSEILGRPIWTHELAFPQHLIAELLGEPEYSSFHKATEELSKRMPVISIVVDERGGF